MVVLSKRGVISTSFHNIALLRKIMVLIGKLLCISLFFVLKKYKTSTTACTLYQIKLFL